jgi:hypothetical protein
MTLPAKNTISAQPCSRLPERAVRGGLWRRYDTDGAFTETGSWPPRAFDDFELLARIVSVCLPYISLFDTFISGTGDRSSLVAGGKGKTSPETSPLDGLKGINRYRGRVLSRREDDNSDWATYRYT